MALELAEKFGKSASTIKAWGGYAALCDQVRVRLPNLKDQWALIGYDFKTDVLEDMLEVEDDLEAIEKAKEGKKILNLQAGKKRRQTMQKNAITDLPETLAEMSMAEQRSLSNGLKLLRSLSTLTEFEQLQDALAAAAKHMDKGLHAPIRRDLTKLCELSERLEKGIDDWLYDGGFAAFKLGGPPDQN